MTGAHGTAPDDLVDQVRRRIADMIARPWLTVRTGPDRLAITGDRVEGRVEGGPHGGALKVVIDGRLMTWDELGDLVADWEGWGFSLQCREP